MTETFSGYVTESVPDLFETRWVTSPAGAASTSPRACLHVVGELDSMSAPLLRRTWDAEVGTLLDQVQVDLGRVSFCNAAGLHELEAILASCRERGLELTLSVQPRLAWLIRVVGLSVDGPAELEVLSRIPTPSADRRGGATAGEAA